MQSFVAETETLESHQKLFDEMLNRFNLSAKAISSATGVSEVMISRFRRGKVDLGAAKLIALLATVPDEAKEWYLAQLLGVKPGISLRSFVISASPQEKAEVLNIIAGWMQETPALVEIEPVAKAV